jgi:hypothetical protein
MFRDIARTDAAIERCINALRHTAAAGEKSVANPVESVEGVGLQHRTTLCRESNQLATARIEESAHDRFDRNKGKRNNRSVS